MKSKFFLDFSRYFIFLIKCELSHIIICLNSIHYNIIDSFLLILRIHKFKHDLLFVSKKIEKVGQGLEEKIIKIRKDLDVQSILKMLKSKINVEDASIQFENIQVSLVGLSKIIHSFKNEFDSHK